MERKQNFSGILGFSNLLLLILMASPLLFGGAQNSVFLRDPDIWWHLRNAQILVTSHHFLRSDVYSFTVHGQPWVNPEWLAELPFYFAHKILGIQGLFDVSFLAFALVIAGVFRLALLRTRDFTASYVATLGFVLLGWINFGPRTILFGWMCLVLEMLVLELSRRREGRLWFLVPLFWVWINTHGSWIIGVVLYVLYVAAGLLEGRWGDIAAERWTKGQLRLRIAVGMTAAAALFLNPYGRLLVFYPFDFAFQQTRNVSRGAEWMSLNFHTGNGKAFLLVLGVLALLTLLRRRTWRLDEVLFTLLAVYAALTYVRFLFLAGILLAPVLAREIAAEGGEREPDRTRPLLNAFLMAAVIAIACIRFPRTATLRQGMEAAFPAQAFARLASFNPQDHIFNAYAYGGFMIWNIPATPTFIDSRTDIFEHAGVYAAYDQVIDQTDTVAVLNQYKIRYVFFPKSDPLVYLLEHIPGWRVNFVSKDAVILERTQN